jgi:hypothetical protein
LIVDDRSRGDLRTPAGTTWELIRDGVMGGVSTGTLTAETVAGRPALRLAGEVRLENNGGFVQMALDLAPGGRALDARGFAAIELDVFGNDERYNLHLRTADVVRPWQSYRASFTAPPRWTTVQLAFADFTPHRVDAALDLATLRRIGIVAIGRAFTADLAVGGVRLVEAAG